MSKTIHNLWTTPISVIDLKPRFKDFDAATEAMRKALPKEDEDGNVKAFMGEPEFQELRGLIREELHQYALDCNIPTDLAINDEFAFCNTYNFKDNSTPHSHAGAGARVVAIYIIYGQGGDHGDTLFLDPRNGIDWPRKTEYNPRGYIATMRVYHREPSVSGKLILSPGYVSHSVETNLREDLPPRQTLGINVYSEAWFRRFQNPMFTPNWKAK